MEEALDAASSRDKSDIMRIATISTPMESVLSHDLHENADDGDIFNDTKNQKCFTENVYLWTGIVVVVVCLITNWLLFEVLPRSMKEDIKEGLILQQHTSFRWSHPNLKAFVTIYVFDINEPDNELPSVTEMGPYVYRLEVHRTNMTWHNNFSVSYSEQHTLFFEEDLSIGLLPKRLQNEKILRNTSTGYVYNIYTGEVHFSQIYQIFSWNFATKLPFWNSEDANTIRGTDGSQFQPFLNEDSKLAFFFPLLKRTFHLKYSESTTSKDLPVYRFTIPDSEFSNSTRPSTSKCSAESLVNDSNSRQPQELCNGNGYCTPSCVPDGIYNITPRNNMYPRYISLPHFLGADPYYLHLLQGDLKPEESKHRSIFEVDKVTGITVNQKRRFQINVHHRLKNVSEVYFPLYWFELSVEVSDDELAHLRNISLSLNMVHAICICIGVALSLLLVGLVSCLIFRIVKRGARSNHVQYVRFGALPGGRSCRISRCC